MTTPAHEYRQCPADKRVVQIRPTRTKYGRGIAWSTYMACDTETQATRVLALLQQPDAARVVLP